ncbi:hypothetical protein Syun_001525 [Stephania yunnanensis]|uniref:Uncharacterized protein n=1 Tax=Stephania yunnanensis TaxID=152371 RepID=A0AAP0LEW7_9MAGN
MAMQATGMSFSKIVLLSGAAYTASIMATNGQLADIQGRLRFISTEFVNKYFHWGNYICDTDCHFWSGFICSFDWEHEGWRKTFSERMTHLGKRVVDELMSVGMANAKQDNHPEKFELIFPSAHNGEMSYKSEILHPPILKQGPIFALLDCVLIPIFMKKLVFSNI